MTNCLQYRCGKPNRTIEGYNIGPVVITEWGADGATITVGNESAPSFGHHAVITSMEYGLSDGIEVFIEVADEQGGAFTTFVDSLVKCMATVSEANRFMKLKFGWVTVDCDNIPNFSNVTPILHIMPMHIDVTYAGGVAKYKITGMDMGQAGFVARESTIIGEDGKEVALKEAITKLCETDEPKWKVQYFRRNPDGTPGGTWDFKDDPKSAFESKNMNKISVIQSWIEPYLTDDNKGIFITVDNLAEDPTLILWEDLPKESECFNPLGTFIVNGGKDGSVIEFNPTINWISALQSKPSEEGGNLSKGGGGSEKIKSNVALKDQGSKAGATSAISSTRHAHDVHGPKNEIKKTEEAAREHKDANQKNRPPAQAINAELRIQGDPSIDFVDIRLIKGRKASIVFVNPFHIMGDGCGDWLASPSCNDVLSNKGWQAMGVNHKIAQGSYITTIKMFLPVPAINTKPGSPLGNTSGGYKTKNDCQ